MKKARISATLLFAMFFVFAGFTACEQSVDDPTVPTLTQDEKTTLLYMLEEEKLARDVYLYFSEDYNMRIFENISASEQKHMDAIQTVLEKYKVDIPNLDKQGVFTLPELQELYDNLIEQGDASLIAALTVGATIEDVDIWDLNNAIAATTKTDLLEMYEMLNCASGNHMRAFTKQLDKRNESYTPQYISQELYEEILNGQHEHCGQ